MDFGQRENPDMDIQKIIAANLNRWMERHSKLTTNKALAAASGVGSSTIQRIRKAQGNVTAENLSQIAAAFKNPPSELLIPQRDPATACKEPDPPSYLKAADAPQAIVEFPSPLPSELLIIVQSMNDIGLQRLIGAAQVLAQQFPKETSANAKT